MTAASGIGWLCKNLSTTGCAAVVFTLGLTLLPGATKLRMCWRIGAARAPLRLVFVAST